MENLRIWAISDIHTLQHQLIVPSSIDMIIVAGDISNSRDSYKNYEECDNFLAWLEIINIRWKLLCAGNHDVNFERKGINMAKFPSIHYLEHESINIEGVNMFFSPYTPSYGVGWAFNKDRGKLDRYWGEIPENTDILVTHGPPKGILDVSEDRSGKMEYCGDKALLNHMYRVKPSYHIFGHIHSYKEHINAGMRTIANLPTQFMNVSCVEDGKPSLTSQGIVFNYKIILNN